jgi:hypothetical protein
VFGIWRRTRCLRFDTIGVSSGEVKREKYGGIAQGRRRKDVDKGRTSPNKRRHPTDPLTSPPPPGVMAGVLVREERRGRLVAERFHDPLSCFEHVSLVLDRHLRRPAGMLEKVIPLLQVLPEAVPPRLFMPK